MWIRFLLLINKPSSILTSRQPIQAASQFCILTKDHIGIKISKTFFCYHQMAKFRMVQGICLYDMYATLASLLQTNWAMFMWLWGVGFCRFWFQKYKILWVEITACRVPIHERRKKVQNKNLHNYSNISTPISDWHIVGWRG